MAKNGNTNCVWPYTATNRRLADRKVAWLWKKPFQILAEKNESAVLSQIANEIRTFFENNFGEK
jgi:hypothetical protein